VARTEDQLRHLRNDRLRSVRLPVGPAPTARRRPSLRAWAQAPGVVGPRWRRSLPLAWVAVYAGAAALEPAPADPSAGDPLWAVGLFLAVMVALVATAAGLARGRRSGLLAGAAGGVLALAGAAACPITAHHTAIGAWWYLQLAGFAALLGAAVVGLRRARAA